MFFKNKQLLDQLDSLNKKITNLDSSIDRRFSDFHSGIDQRFSDFHSGIDQRLSDFHSTIQKHDMALEDLLDEWEERQSDEQAVQGRMKELEQNEARLLTLVEAFQEQFWSLKRFAISNQDTALSAQAALMEQSLERSNRLCGIHVIQECGIEVDYNLYEIIEAIDTDDPSLDKKIADIYQCGYIYKGTVKKKAKASAYRLRK